MTRWPRVSGGTAATRSIDGLIAHTLRPSAACCRRCPRNRSAVETDKATVAFESTDDGYVAAILVEEGAQDVPVGTPVLVMVEEEEDVAAFANFTAADAGAVPAGEDTASAPTVDEGAAPPAPEPVAAPQPAAPSAAPAAAAAPQEAPAKPAAPAAAAPAQAEGEEQLAFASWGHSILSSPISKT